MNKKCGIAVAGSVLVDKIYEISAYPAAGELTKICGIEYSVGGCVPNVAADLKKLSPELPIYAIGKVGTDADGEFVIKTLSDIGVNTDHIVRSESEKTSFTDVMSVRGGQRTFFTYPGASADFGKDDVTLPEDVGMLHLGYLLLLDKVDGGDGVEILKAASERGIKTSIDLVSENSTRYSLVLPCLPYTDDLIINEVEAGMLTGIEPTDENLKRIAEELMRLGVRERVIIHKPDVGVCLSADGFTYLPSFELPSGYIKGTTGAGDAFCAGALIGIHGGMSDKEILELASMAAVMALGTADATSGLDEIKKIISFTQKLDRKKICL